MNGEKHCLGMDVLDQRGNAMVRFVAPVTMLATGGCGQVCAASCFIFFITDVVTPLSIVLVF